MQTIVRNETNVSLYLYGDDKTISIGSNSTTVSDGGTLELIISDCNSSNATLHTSVENKSDYVGCKYKYDGSAWSNNENYVEPNDG